MTTPEINGAAAANNPTQTGIPHGAFSEDAGSEKTTPAAGAPAAQGAPQTPPATTPPATPPATTLGDPAKPELPAPNADTSQPFTYEPTGDPGLDYALGFLGRNGFTDAHPGVIAAQQGDFAMLKAALAEKNVPGSAEVVAMAEAAYAKFAKQGEEAQAQVANYAATAAGSAENWQAVRSWATAEATPEEKATINAQLQQGGMAAQMAIKYLVDAYSSKHQINRAPADAVKEGASSSPGRSSEPLTAQAYAKAVQELTRAAKGRDITGSNEYAALQAQRIAAKRAGY